MNQNKVASILKGYGIVNGIAGIILAFIIGNETSGYIAILYAAAVIFVSFAIYAFGEVVEILHDIRENTKVEKDILSAVQGQRNSDAFSHHNGGEVATDRKETVATPANITKQIIFAERYEDAEHILETEENKSADNGIKEAIFDARRDGYDTLIICPKCGTQQRANRSLCLNCSLPFKYKDEM